MTFLFSMILMIFEAAIFELFKCVVFEKTVSFGGCMVVFGTRFLVLSNVGVWSLCVYMCLVFCLCLELAVVSA